MGSDTTLAADANASYDLGEARRLFGVIDDFGLQCVEQPCATDAFAAHATLVEEVRTPICLDETITSVAAAQDAIEQHACRAIAIKVGRLGIADASACTTPACTPASTRLRAG